MRILKGLGGLVVSLDVEDASFWNLAPLYTTVSKNVISFSEISALNFTVGWSGLACSINRSMSVLFTDIP